MNLSILANSSTQLEDEIYIHGLKDIIKLIFKENGGVTKISKKLERKPSAIKEWGIGRRPISIRDLKELLKISEIKNIDNLKNQIDKKEKWMSCKYSWRKLKFPNALTEDLAYIVGLILGDGSLAGNQSNKKGNWSISAFFDNKDHRAYFDKLIKKELGFYPKHFLTDKNYHLSCFCSKAAHYLFRNFFEIPNGYKSSIIIAPKIIVNASVGIQSAFIRGLFDSDGTFTSNEVRYSTTSKKMAEQMHELLDLQGIKSSTCTWQKKGPYKLLYTIYIRSKQGKEEYYKKVGFEHPNKKLLLKNSLIAP